MNKVTIQLFGYYNVAIKETKSSHMINGEEVTVWKPTKKGSNFEYVKTSDNCFKQVQHTPCGWIFSDELPVVC